MKASVTRYFSLILIISTAMTLPATAQPSDDSVTEAVQKFFLALNNKDTAALSAFFTENSGLSSVVTVSEENTDFKRSDKNGFIKGIGQLKDVVIDERIRNLRVLRDGHMANTWMDYDLYVNNAFHHCGVNNILWIWEDERWLIANITDTRKKAACDESIKVDIHKLVDDWHVAAATADEHVFFGSMTADAVYLGTDQTERWLKPEFEVWSAKYFQRESAWAFAPYDRYITVSDDGQLAWWDELLNTWMGVCRGSGVARLDNGVWKISHYHLSVTIANEKIDGFLELIGKE